MGNILLRSLRRKKHQIQLKYMYTHGTRQAFCHTLRQQTDRNSATVCIKRRSSGILTWNTSMHNTLFAPLYFVVARTDSTVSNTEISLRTCKQI